VPGAHNIKNAMACAALCRWAGVPIEVAAEILAQFTNVRRRFDVLRESSVAVVDDYAHHPTEVDTVVQSARRCWPDRQLVCVFQPHQHSRLRVMRKAFADVLARADSVIVTPVYRARDSEEDARSVSSAALATELTDRGRAARHAADFTVARGLLDSVVREPAAVLFLGAGDITELARDYADSFASQRRQRSTVEPIDPR
jgi:UDP-N-acetylmuramate--alanine ligase